MSSIISPNLQKFTKQILSLVPYASNDRLEYLIQKLLPEETAGRQLAELSWGRVLSINERYRVMLLFV